MTHNDYTAERAEFLNKLSLPEKEPPANVKILWYDVLTSENVKHLIYAGEHLHTFCEMQISLCGSFVYECDGKREEVFCGEALFIPSQTNHKYISCSEDSVKLSIGFAMLCDESLSIVANLKAGKTKALPEIIENANFIFRMSDKRNIFTPTIITSRAFEMIYIVCESLGARMGELAVSYQDTRFILAKSFIEQNKNRLLSCEDVARECGLSVKQLGRIFRKNCELSVFDYIVTVKTEYAKTLLLGGEESIKEITYMLGFKNEGSFTSFFKRHCGISPCEFRKIHKRSHSKT